LSQAAAFPETPAGLGSFTSRSARNFHLLGAPASRRPAALRQTVPTCRRDVGAPKACNPVRTEISRTSCLLAKRQRAGALQDALRISGIIVSRAQRLGLSTLRSSPATEDGEDGRRPSAAFPRGICSLSFFDRFVDGFASILPEISKNLGDSSLSLFVTSHSCKFDHPLQRPLNSVNCDVCALADMTPSCRPEERRAFNELVQPLLARLARLYSGGLACALPKLCQRQSSCLRRGRA